MAVRFWDIKNVFVGVKGFVASIAALVIMLGFNALVEAGALVGDTTVMLLSIVAWAAGFFVFGYVARRLWRWN